MGQWNITVRGTGCHHNPKLATDANRMAAEFVERLKTAGHVVMSASFTYGGDEDITDSAKYIEDKAKQDAEFDAKK